MNERLDGRCRIACSCFAIDNLFIDGDEVWIGLEEAILMITRMIESQSVFEDIRFSNKSMKYSKHDWNMMTRQGNFLDNTH